MTTPPTKEQVIQEALELSTQIQAAVAALESETDPMKVLDHVGLILDRGRINALRSVLRERTFELLDMIRVPQ